VPAVRPCNDGHDHGAVLRVAAHRSETVVSPAQRHYAVAANSTVSRTQPGYAAGTRGSKNRSTGFGSDRESNATGARRRTRTCRRSTGSGRNAPRISSHSAKPVGALRHLAGGQFRKQHGAAFTQHLNNTGIIFRDIILHRGGAPGGGVSLDRNDVLASPWN